MAKTVRRKGRDTRKGVQSIEIGAQLLHALSQSPGALTLRDLSAAGGMSASKAHRYLVSLVRAGLVEQNPTTSQYDLGEVSLRIGLAALNRLDVVRFGTQAAIDLNQRTDATVILSVWGTTGPTVIALYNSTEMLLTNLAVGSTLPLTRSASGQIYLAYMPRSVIAARVERELKGAYAQSSHSRIKNWKDIDKLTAQVRKDRLGATHGEIVPDQSALAAPIFDHQGRLAAALAIIGVSSVIERASSHSPASLLHQYADNVSHRMGFSTGGDAFVEWQEADSAARTKPKSDPPALRPSPQTNKNPRSHT